MIAEALLFFAQADAAAPRGSTLEVVDDPGFVFTCGDPDNNAAEAAICEAEEAECADPQTQQAMTRCALADYQAADTELNAQWLATVAAMKARDARRQPGDPRPGYFDTLLKAQSAWLAYRDAECATEAALAGRPSGRSVEVTLEHQCKTYLTQLRIEQLRVLAAGPE
jgi:uncharacterized protein YecT (DUF1311 family)